MFIITPLDSALFFALLFFVFFGFARGFIKEASSIINWIGAIYLTVLLKPMVMPLLEKKITTPFLLDMVANALLFAVLVLVMSLFTTYVGSFLSKVIPDNINRGLGFFFGLLKSYLVSSLVLATINTIYLNIDDDKKPEWYINSMSYTVMNDRNGFFNGMLRVLLGDFINTNTVVLEEENAKVPENAVDDVDVPDYDVEVLENEEEKNPLGGLVDMIKKDAVKNIIKEPTTEKNENADSLEVQDKGYDAKEIDGMNRLVDILVD